MNWQPSLKREAVCCLHFEEYQNGKAVRKTGLTKTGDVRHPASTHTLFSKVND